jgi:PAS domain S-box-containing protein
MVGLDGGGWPFALGFTMVSLALVALGYIRTRQILRFRDRMLKGQELEIAFHRKAIHEYALVTITDTDGTIVDVNPKFLSTLGYRREDLIGRPHRELHVPEEAEISDIIREGTRRGAMWSGHTQMLRADGTVALTQTTVVPLINEQGEHVKNMSLRVDITKNQAEKNEKLVTSAFTKMLEAVVVHDPQTFKIVYMNEFALHEHGWTTAEAETKTMWDTIYVPDREIMRGLCEQIDRDGKSTMVLETPGQDRTYEARSYDISVGGSEQRVLTIFRDVTQNVVLERERNHLVSVITHELRTPLTSIKGSLGLLDASAFGPMSTDAKSLVSIALRNSDRMLELIRDILEAEKAGEIEASGGLRPVDLSAAVDAAITANLGYGAQLGIEFVNPGTEPELWVLGDDGVFAQILANLMSNAAKFSPDGGAVKVWAERDGAQAVLLVRDNGNGIPAELQPRLFDRYTQAGSGERGQGHSSGLGLSIVKAQVERLGGKIDFETSPAQGTCFRVSLPLATNESRPFGEIAASA